MPFGNLRQPLKKKHKNMDRSDCFISSLSADLMVHMVSFLDENRTTLALVNKDFQTTVRNGLLQLRMYNRSKTTYMSIHPNITSLTIFCTPRAEDVARLAEVKRLKEMNVFGKDIANFMLKRNASSVQKLVMYNSAINSFDGASLPQVKELQLYGKGNNNTRIHLPYMPNIHKLEVYRAKIASCDPRNRVKHLVLADDARLPDSIDISEVETLQVNFDLVLFGNTTFPSAKKVTLDCEDRLINGTILMALMSKMGTGLESLELIKTGIDEEEDDYGLDAVIAGFVLWPKLKKLCLDKLYISGLVISSILKQLTHIRQPMREGDFMFLSTLPKLKHLEISHRFSFPSFEADLRMFRTLCPAVRVDIQLQNGTIKSM